MKKFKLIIILILTLIISSCNEKEKITTINDYVKNIDLRDDLSESITEFETEIYEKGVLGGIDIYELTDSLKNIYRITVNVSKPNDSVGEYEFYYKNDSLVFARIKDLIQSKADNQLLDTLVDSEFYFDKNELLKRFDKKNENYDGEIIRQISEFYIVYGKHDR